MVFIFHKNEAYLSYKPKCKIRNTLAGSNSTPFRGEIEKWRNNSVLLDWARGPHLDRPYK